ncbi:MAG: MBL fold metallo-hydrolase [Actinomycetes bacterium]
MRLWLLGVRGSTPAPGADFVRYGGHTSCVAVLRDDADVPDLVLDAGTGLRALTDRLDGAPYRGAVLLSHLHWDHVQGLPVFAAADRGDAAVQVWVPAQDGRDGRDLLAQSMSPPSFPIEPGGLAGSWSFDTLEAGSHGIAGWHVRACEVAHKGGRTFGYRVEDVTGSIAYLPDHAPALGCSDEVRDLVSGVDVLVHDAQFRHSEREIADRYGHATINDAVALAVAADVGTLVLSHHAPTRTDEALDEIAAEVCQASPVPVLVAREGDTIIVRRPA